MTRKTGKCCLVCDTDMENSLYDDVLSYHIYSYMPSGVEGTKAFARAVQYLSKHQDEVYNSIIKQQINWYGQGISLHW